MKEQTHISSRALAAGTILPHNYIIDHVIGEGGFGITYCCNLLHTDEQVAIKEYFPDNIAYRTSDNTILPYENQADLFEREHRHFLTEASILLDFRHLEHIVKVKDLIKANGTSYLVMEYIDGITLKQYVTDNEPLSFDELSDLILPVLRDLIQVHGKGLLHLDISPDNVILGTDNQLHLIDFGSAGFESDATHDSKTVILKSGYAPPEQYLATGKLGAWTDVYGICATIYFTLTGFPPTDALERMQGASLPPLTDHAQIRSWQADVITTGLQLAAGDRYQTIEELYQTLCIPPVEIISQRSQAIRHSYKSEKTVLPTSISDTSKTGKFSKTPTKRTAKRRPLFLVLSLFLFLLLFYCGLGFGGVALPFWPKNQASSDTTPTEEDATETSSKNQPESNQNNTSHETTNTDASTQATTTATKATKQTTKATTKQAVKTESTKVTAKQAAKTESTKVTTKQTTKPASTKATRKQTTKATTKQAAKTESTKAATKQTTKPASTKQNAKSSSTQAKSKKKSSEKSDRFITLPEDDSYDSFTN